MSTRSPHNNFSINKLLEIKNNNFYCENTKKDYDPNEVEQLIYHKQNKQLEKELKERIKQEIELLNLRGFKTCTKCKWTLPKKYFSPDKSKKSGLRSHCKPCRNVGLYDYLTVLQCCDNISVSGVVK